MEWESSSKIKRLVWSRLNELVVSEQRRNKVLRLMEEH